MDINEISQIPSNNDWGDILDPDVYDAYEVFFGKNIDDLQCEFKKNSRLRCINLNWMPIKPFKYYIFSLQKYIQNDEFGLFDKADAVSSFIDLVEKKSRDYPDEIRQIYESLKPTIWYVVDKQVELEADIDIYGDFKEKALRIERSLKKL